MVLPQSLCLSLYPQISASALSDLQQLRKIGRGAMRYLLALSLPTAIGITMLAAPILQLLYGEAFRAAAYTLSVLILTLVPYGIVRYHAYVLVGANHQRIDLALNVVMSVHNVLLNLWLIPRYGHLGAALGLEDAVVLARSLERHGPGTSALARYEAARVARCASALRDSRTQGGLYQAAEPEHYGAAGRTAELRLPYFAYDATTVPF